MCSETVYDPATGETFPLTHLKPFYVTYEIKMGDEVRPVTVRVHFTSHCYTRSKQAEDREENIILTENHRNGPDYRVFCEKRWRFSQELPKILEELAYSNCLTADQAEIVYRHINPQPIKNPYAGWYICMRLSGSQKHQNITLSVRSVHWRHNHPGKAVGRPKKRFRIVLGEFIRKKQIPNEWL